MQFLLVSMRCSASVKNQIHLLGSHESSVQLKIFASIFIILTHYYFFSLQLSFCQYQYHLILVSFIYDVNSLHLSVFALKTLILLGCVLDREAFLWAFLTRFSVICYHFLLKMIDHLIFLFIYLFSKKQH